MSVKDSTKNDRNESLDHLIGKTDPAEDEMAREKIIHSRVSMLLNHSFFGNLATRLVLENADEFLPTAATDGKYFYYNSKFINMLKPKEVEFLVGHEVLHAAYDHMGRCGDRHKTLYNAAADYAINLDLVTHKIGELITTVPALYDKQYWGMSSEEIYDKLLENAEEIDMDEYLNKMFDEHMDGDDQGYSKLSEEERKQARDEFKEAMIAAAENSGAGDIPGGLERMINQLTEPKLDWKEILRQQIQSTIKSDISYMRPSRKSHHLDAIMPGLMNGDMIDVAIAIDTSGSISEKMLIDFLSEIKGIMEDFESFKMTVFCFDTEVHNPQTYYSENMPDITDYKLAGFGGTSFNCIFKWMKENEVEPNRLVVFTDMCPFDGFGDPNYCDTLWINHSREKIRAPYGVTVDYTD